MGTRSPDKIQRLSKRVRAFLIAGAGLLAVLVVGSPVVEMYVNWLWFGEVGFRRVWFAVLLTQLAIFVAVAALVGGAVSLALLRAYRARPPFLPATPKGDPIAPYRTLVMRRPRRFGWGIALAFGVVCGLIARSDWVTVQLFLHGGSFGILDPEFGHDIGFFVFDLPFYRSVLNWLFVAVCLAFVASLAAHYLFGGLRLTTGKGMLTQGARIQLAVLAGTLILLKAVAYWFDRYELLSGGRKEPIFTGGGYTDLHAALPAKLVLVAIAVLCAVAFFVAIFTHDMRIPAMAAALLVLSAIAVGGVWPLLMEQFSVRPNAADVESPYIQRNIDATRQAFRLGSDWVEYQDYPGVGTKPPRGVPADVTTIANVRLLDPNVLSRTFTQQQQLKNFYGFPDHLDLDRYRIDGDLQDYVVGVRELSPNSLTGNQQDWINRHTVYTHGNGFVAAPANRVNAAVGDAAEASESNSGYPLYTVSDIASQGSARQIIPVDQPRIYFGEVIAQADPDYAIVGGPPGSTSREYDTDASKYTYTGAGGVPIGNWFNRTVFATRFAQHRFLFSRDIGSESKVIFHRDPKDRVQRVAPWLTTDADAYPAAVRGRIVWIVDAYTTLETYPYAQRASLEGPVSGPAGSLETGKEVSYARNSVKATVDAYDGTVTLYQVDRNDPVLRAWMRAFPGAVKPEGEINDELRAHFRYPKDLFKVQRELIAKYHVDEPREFFTTNAFWSVPSDPTDDANPAQPPFYVLVGDQQTSKPTFRLATAMVGYNREFLSAYISARSDPENYGKLTVLQLPTDTLTQGPQQIQNSMISDTRVASERTLLERSNRIHYGNLLTLPIADGGVLYVEPLYTERISTNPNSSTFPQLSRVLASVREPRAGGGVRVGYAPTLAEALDQVFGPGTAAPPPPPVVTQPRRHLRSLGRNLSSQRLPRRLPHQDPTIHQKRRPN